MKNDSLVALGKRIRLSLANRPKGENTQEWLRSQMGVTQGAVSQWLSGLQKPKDITGLAIILGVDRDWLLTGNEPLAEYSSRDGRFSEHTPIVGPVDDTVPLLGYADASDEAFFVDFEVPEGNVRRHPKQVGKKNAAAIKPRGDSMYPRYKDGDTVYLNIGQEPMPHQDCIVQMMNGESFLKQFVRKTKDELICCQYRPEKEWKRKLKDVMALHAVVGRG